MAKKIRRLLAVLLALTLCISTFATPAFAKGHGRPGNDNSDGYEWYQVIVNGSVAASGQGPNGDVGWLVRGVYSYGVSIRGTTMSWRAGNQSGSVNVAKYISIPDGFEVAEGGYTVASHSVSGTNSQSAQYDNAVITVNITALFNPTTGETLPVPEPTDPQPTTPPVTEPPVTEPPATEAPKVETTVTVNHKYSTYDIHTGETVTDGTTTGTYDATEDDTYTAVPLATYEGNVYVRQTGDEALSITVAADAAANVINIEYLRTIDTTPIPVATKVTVNHKYSTYDIHTGETVTDGTASVTADAVAGDTYTAQAVPSYNGNSYEQTAASPAMTIEVAADAAANVINIEYLRTIDTTPVNYTPAVTVVKTADKEVYEHGETITWTITVKNVSEHTAYNVVVADELTGDTWTVAELAPGAERSFTATTENAAPGSVKNTVVVSWDDNDEVPDEEEPNEIKDSSDEIVVSVNDPIPENYTPVLSVVKTADKAVCKEGETITFTITVKNVSDYPAYNIVIVDELAKGYWTIAELAAGAEQVFNVTMENVAAGSVKNTVVVSWDDGDEIPDEEEEEVTEVTDEEIVIVEELINYTPILSITKTAGKSVYKVGQNIKWTITVKNISEYTAYNVVVVDEMTGDRWVIEALGAGEEKIFTATTKATKTGSVTNAVVVSWEDGDEIDDAKEPAEPKSASSEDTVKIEKKTTPVETQPTDPAPTDPAPTEQVPAEPVAQGDEIEIIDEDVPLASAPKTGDISVLWVALSGISAAGMILLGKKREDDEE